MKYGLQGNAILKITPKFALTPSIITWWQGPSFELLGGTGLQFLLKENSQNIIEFGAAIRLANRATPFTPITNRYNNISPPNLWADALVFSINYQHQRFIIGLSYDFNVSDLNQVSNGNGAYEIALIYRFCE